MSFLANINVFSEFRATKKEIYNARMTEYIQSIIVSSPNKYEKKDEKKDPSIVFYAIQADVIEIFELIGDFLLCWSLKGKDIYPEWDDDTSSEALEAQLLFFTRGQRYQIFEEEYYRKLLAVHTNIFMSLFGISAEEIVVGFEKLRYSITQGKADVFNECGVIINQGIDYSSISSYEHHTSIFTETHDLITDMYDVMSITNWPQRFAQELSYGINEVTGFIGKHDFSGWPIIDLPIQKRPFIKLEDKIFCFDYCSLADNFYRVLQKTIKRLEPEYDWSTFQQDASECFTEEVFKSLLPGCTTYRNNFYPNVGSMKQPFENDLLVQYDNVLIVAEVKAGSFVYTPPITDFYAHITSYKSLIEKADQQCSRTVKYLSSQKHPIIFNSSKQNKAEIDMTYIKYIYKIAITMDNINEFAAKAAYFAVSGTRVRSRTGTVSRRNWYSVTQSWYTQPSASINRKTKAAEIERGPGETSQGSPGVECFCYN